MAHVFISYVREDAQSVEVLCDSLRENQVKIWIDRNDIPAGTRWKRVIRKAINEGDFFIACFSPSYIKKRTTYMNEELTLAIDILRQKPVDRAWFIPVLLSECEVPDRDIGAGETLLDIQQVRLYEDWEIGIKHILSVIKSESDFMTDFERVGTKEDIRETDTDSGFGKAGAKGDIRETDAGPDVLRDRTTEAIRGTRAGSPGESRYQTVGETISVLFLAANPSDTPSLRIEMETREIQSKILQSNLRERFSFEMRWATSTVDLQRALLSIRPRIVHFLGHHGARPDEFVLEDNSGRSRTVSTDALVSLFRPLRDQIDCIILNVSYSSTMATALAKEIKYVIGINSEIGDRDAMTFAAAFYQSLAAGRSIETAFELASVAISLSSSSQNGTPVLIMRG